MAYQAKNHEARIYIGNVNPRVREDSIRRVFEEFGKVWEILMKGSYLFVEYEHEKSAVKAIEKMHGRDFEGRKIVVEPARRPLYTKDEIDEMRRHGHERRNNHLSHDRSYSRHSRYRKRYRSHSHTRSRSANSRNTRNHSRDRKGDYSDKKKEVQVVIIIMIMVIIVILL